MLPTTLRTSHPATQLATLVIFAAALVSGASTHDDQGDGILKSVQIEYFKENLLKKLGLEAPPRITGPSIPPPEPLVRKVEAENRRKAREDDDDDDEEAVGRHQEHILFPKAAHCTHRPRELCFRFDLTEYQRHDVTKAEVWVHLPDSQGNETLLLSEVPVFGSFGIIRQYPLHPNPHQWVQVDIQQSVRRWITSRRANPEMAIVCNLRETEDPASCIGDLRWETRPFLLLKTAPIDSKRRRKRSYPPRCPLEPQYCCERRNLLISFAELGWNFIISPTTLTTAFCWGECSSVGLIASDANRTSLHASFMQHLSSTRDTWYLQPCCSPTQYSSVSILYSNTRGEYLYDEINLVVRSCGCR